MRYLGTYSVIHERMVIRSADTEIQECLESISSYFKEALTFMFLLMYVMSPIRAKPPPIGVKIVSYIYLCTFQLAVISTP